MVVFLDVMPDSVDPKRREKRHHCAFSAEHVVQVREILAIGAKDDKRTKIVFRGDNYEHHAVETDLGFESVLALIGWTPAESGGGP